jgi:hypothetical protein
MIIERLYLPDDFDTTCIEVLPEQFFNLLRTPVSIYLPGSATPVFKKNQHLVALVDVIDKSFENRIEVEEFCTSKHLLLFSSLQHPGI